MQALQSSADEDYSAEELELMRRAEEHRQKIMQDLYQKQQEEVMQKNAKRAAALQALAEFKETRQKQMQLTRQNNIQIEQGRNTAVEDERNSLNKWDRVCKNVDLTSKMGPGGTDLSRMKAAMCARRADFAGGAAGASQGNFNF